MSAIALDLSLRSAGWAHWVPGEQVASFGHWELADSTKTVAKGYVRLHKHLYRLWQEFGPFDVLVFEQAIPAHAMKGKTNAATVKALSGIEAHAMSFAEAVGVRWHSVPVGSWRRHFLGSLPATSRVDKKTLAQIMAKELGMRTAVHDEAEAIGLLDYQLHVEGITPPWRVKNPLTRQLRPDLLEA